MNRRSFIQRIASFVGLSLTIPAAAVPVEPSDFPDVDLTEVSIERIVRETVTEADLASHPSVSFYSPGVDDDRG